MNSDGGVDCTCGFQAITRIYSTSSKIFSQCCTAFKMTVNSVHPTTSQCSAVTNLSLTTFSPNLSPTRFLRIGRQPTFLCDFASEFTSHFEVLSFSRISSPTNCFSRDYRLRLHLVIYTRKMIHRTQCFFMLSARRNISFFLFEDPRVKIEDVTATSLCLHTIELFLI